MNIRDLKYLVAIADHRHFGKAADACFVSQPALSMQIKKLEETLDIQLIERTNKSVLLTESGKAISEQARSVLQQVNEMRDYAKQAKDPLSGQFSLGIIPTLAPYLLPHIIPELTKIFKKLTIYLVEEQTANLKTQLKQGKIDAALLALPFVDDDFVTLPLFEEEFLLAVHANHALTKRKTIRTNDLENKELLLLEEGHCLRDQALSICQTAKATVTKNFQATSLETLRHMVAAKVGITLMPKLAYKNNDGIYYLPFATPRPTRSIGMVWRASNTKRILFENIVEQIRKLMTKQKIVKVLQTPIFCTKSIKKL